ncbi:mandelate racemase/muconate lactonizing enzyme family protein [Salinirubellus sp. GCM10025818]|uniref:mandelate racemase/muconate lactonizing enzyme family protein n=1 Tax=Salinirubellus TaxID=2162630 RepID=UPI0030CCEBE5
MQVRSVAAIPLSHPLEEGRSFGHARGLATARSATLVRVETADGTVGWGEALAPPRSVATVVDEVVCPHVEGRDPHEIETLAERLYAGAYHVARGALTQCALSAVDIALWDILGKEAGEPIYRLLGGDGSREIVPYASTAYITEWGEDPAESIREAVDEGFAAAKLKIGRSVEDDVERVAAAREVMGDDARIMVDCNGNYRPKQAVRSAEALAPYDLTWFEEPIPPEDFEGYRYLRERVDVPIAAGEAHYSRFEFDRLLDVVDVVQPDLCRAGGFSESRVIAKLATTRNVAVRPHVWNAGVGVAAALQYAASLPAYPHVENEPGPFLFEFDRSPNPLRDELLEEPFDPTGGTLEVPSEPGLGVTVDEDAVERYRVER